MDDYELTYWLGTNDNQGEFITRSVKIKQTVYIRIIHK